MDNLPLRENISILTLYRRNLRFFPKNFFETDVYRWSQHRCYSVANTRRWSIKATIVSDNMKFQSRFEIHCNLMFFPAESSKTGILPRHSICIAFLRYILFGTLLCFVVLSGIDFDLFDLFSSSLGKI